MPGTILLLARIAPADLFAAAAAYQPNLGLSDEADEAYDNAQGAAAKLIEKVTDLATNKLEDVEKAFYGDDALLPVDANALKIANEEKVEEYNEAVEALEEAKEYYDLAKALVMPMGLGIRP